MSEETVKQKVQSVVEQLPDNSSWDDIMRELHVHHVFDSGMVTFSSGRPFKKNEA